MSLFLVWIVFLKREICRWVNDAVDLCATDVRLDRYDLAKDTRSRGWNTIC